jgi:hypothetical protein
MHTLASFAIIHGGKYVIGENINKNEQDSSAAI